MEIKVSRRRAAFSLVLVAAMLAELPAQDAVLRSIQVGATDISIRSRAFGASRLLFCNLHDDENTSVEAALAVLAKKHGRLVEIKHSGDRNCVFQLDEQEYKFDPNRIFTAPGVRLTLEKLSQTNARAEQAVSRFGKALLELYAIDGVDVVIALHNNTDARYSAANYLQGNALAKEAADVFIARDADTDDFFFVTDRRLFEALKKRDLNVVLQNNENVTDDGSLSVYCGQQRKPYVNVEAQHGHLTEQVKMIEQLFGVIEELELSPSAP
jgi:hypothetical protein